MLVPPSQNATISVVDQSSGCRGREPGRGINFTRAELMGRGVRFLRRFEMCKRVLGLTISALILAYGPGAIAQEQMTQQPDQQQMQSHPMGQEDAGTMGQGGGMMGRGRMGGHM